MALGGGKFTAQDKILPGSYINIISKAAAAETGSRGVVAMGLSLDWGPEAAIFEVTAAKVKSMSYKLFGYSYDADEMINVRELFRHATKLIAYRLNGGGTKAANTFATAKYGGTRGNSFSTVITANVDDTTKFDVTVKLAGITMDTQTVTTAAGLVDDDYVTFIKTATLAAGTTVLTGGTNGTVSGTTHQAFLDALESCTFNTLGLDSDDTTTIGLYTAYAKRMRNDRGLDFQLVVYNTAADFEGVINVKNAATGTDVKATSLVYWVAGASAGCALSKSLTNQVYDGEYEMNTDYTQMQLEDCIAAGEFTFHKVGSEVHVLTDINSLVTYTDEKNKYFSQNDVIRSIDGFCTDISAAFSSFIGKTTNNKAGRTAFWSKVVSIGKDYEKLGCFEDFDSADFTISEGSEKTAAVVTGAVTVTQAMGKLYMTVTIA